MRICLLFILFLVIAQNINIFASERDEPQHYANKVSIGFNMGFGYNMFNHVDGSLGVIPNKLNPVPSPGNPVTPTYMSINVDAPQMTVEYWMSPSYSIQTQTGVTMIIAGADHPVSKFAYIFAYWKIASGFRFYFDKVHVSPLFIGLGWFVNLPINTMIGFLSSANHASVTTGPYMEIGMNYPVTQTLNIEVYGRFYWTINSLTHRNDPTIYTNIALSPVVLGFGLNWTLGGRANHESPASSSEPVPLQ